MARRETLQRELDAIAEVRAEEQALCDELRSVEKALRVGPLLGLGVPTVAMPCDVPWDDAHIQILRDWIAAGCPA